MIVTKATKPKEDKEEHKGPNHPLRSESSRLPPESDGESRSELKAMRSKTSTARGRE